MPNKLTLYAARMLANLMESMQLKPYGGPNTVIGQSVDLNYSNSTFIASLEKLFGYTPGLGWRRALRQKV